MLMVRTKLDMKDGDHGLVAHVCCKASSDACHTVAILDVAHGNVQQATYNVIAVQTCHSQSHFLPYMMSSEC